MGLDILLRHHYVDPVELATAAASRPRCRAIGAIRLADGRAESPQESRMRVRLVLAGLPAPVPQFEIRRDGRFLARADFAWPEQRVILEYDGAWHADTAQLHRDRKRLNTLIDQGWKVYHATAADLRDPTAFARLVALIRGALAA